MTGRCRLCNAERRIPQGVFSDTSIKQKFTLLCSDCFGRVKESGVTCLGVYGAMLLVKKEKFDRVMKKMKASGKYDELISDIVADKLRGKAGGGC